MPTAVRALTALDRSGFSSLRNRNFRLYLVGQSVSQAGTWMQTVAMGWLVLKLTGSGALLGLVTAAQFAPALLFGPYAGALADRQSRWRILQIAQILAGVLAGALAVLVSTDVIRVWSLFVLAVLIGTVNAFDVPVRSSFLYEMVGPDDLTGAIGVSSTMNNASRIVGPAVAGGLIAWLGIASCFYVNSASYLACTITFLLMRRDEFEAGTAVAGRAGNVRSGLRAVWRDPQLRTPLLMAVVIGTFAYENQISVPLLAKYTFGGDASSYGLLSSAMGVGAVVGGLAVARSGRANHRRQGYAALFLGFAMLAASAMPTMGAMLVAMVVVGGASVAFITMTSATLQLTAPTELRGRVLALYVTALIGTTPIGGPIIGWIGEVIDPRATYVTGGVACVATAAVAWRSLARSQERSVTDAEARAIEEMALHEAEQVEAGAASAIPVAAFRPESEPGHTVVPPTGGGGRPTAT